MISFVEEFMNNLRNGKRYMYSRFWDSGLHDCLTYHHLIFFFWDAAKATVYENCQKSIDFFIDDSKTDIHFHCFCYRGNVTASVQNIMRRIGLFIQSARNALSTFNVMEGYTFFINPADILIELIEVSVHNILFIRNLYPKSIFALKKKYGVPVHVSMYPDLNLYISESLKAMKELLRVNELEEVAVCFVDEKRNKIVERFVFNVLRVKSHFENSTRCEGPNLPPINEVFRAFMLKLSISDTYLKPLPEDSSFKICIKTKESGLVSLSEDHRFESFPWIELEDKETVMEDPNLIPIRALDTESLHLEIFVECI